MKLRKADFFLKIETPQPDSFETPGTLVLTAWYTKNPTMMVDEGICESFPFLENLDMGDLSEGTLEYWGPLNKQDLKVKLDQLGFQTVVI